MKSSSQKTVNPLRLLIVFMVLGLGQSFALAGSSPQAKAQLHIPWKLLSERLSAVVNRHESDGSATPATLAPRLISVPYDDASLNWNLTSGSVSSTVHVDQSVVRDSDATIAISNAKVRVVLDSLTVDQVIERSIGGVVVRVHLSAACGPIVLDQAAAKVNAVFGLKWANGTPSASLSKLDLSWAPNSWTFHAFTCTGPSGTDQLVHDGLASFLKDPASLKSYVEQYVSSNLQSGIEDVIARLREPFTVGQGSSLITVSVGTLLPAPTGVLADLSLRTNSKEAPLPPLPVPTSAVLGALSTSQPVLIGDKSVIEFIVASQLAARPPYVRVNLQEAPAFHKLMKNRVEQLFVWQDLWHFSANSPFYLNLANPRTLSLSRGTRASLTSNVPLKSYIQAYRENTWWDYVDTRGTAAASVAITVKNGVMSYATTITRLNVKSEYGSDYRKRFNKTSGPLKDSVISKAIAGPQAALSGKMKWPDVDLAEAGLYRASSYSWASGNTFSLVFSVLK